MSAPQGSTHNSTGPILRVLVYSPAFLPNLGGLETSTCLLAKELYKLGCDVVVITRTPTLEENSLPFRVVRDPGLLEFIAWTRWCNVFYQANVSLRGLWPLLLVRRPWVVSHHSWYRAGNGSRSIPDRLKRAAIRFAAGSIAVSTAVADDLESPSIVIHNAYDAETFREMPGVARTKDLIFVGRLVSDKGVDVLLEALSFLAVAGVEPTLTIVGQGPERGSLERMAADFGISERVSFVGAKPGGELAPLLNEHRILVVPSRYEEPFGIVALEGIACGCVVVGSSGGGLPEAIGDCGELFRNGDADGLSATLARLLATPEQRSKLRSAAACHLAAHSPAQFGRSHLQVLRRALIGA